MTGRHHRVISRTDAPWFPEALLDAVAGRSVRFSFSPGERKIFRKRKAVLVSDWAERNRRLTDGPMAGRMWQNWVTPWSTDMMNASMLPSVRKVVNCKAVQTGGTSWIYTCLGYAMDRKAGPTLIVYPDRDRCRKAMSDRVQPMIQQSPVLARLLTGKDDDQASMRVKLINMLIYMGWSGSIASLADFPTMYLVKDEADKWQEFPSKDEAGSHDSADKRVTVFPHDSKIFDNSTPSSESGHIWQALLTETQVISNYHVVCPDCGRDQVMIFANIKWNGGSTVNRVDMVARKLARYVCCWCGALWDDHRRDLAARAGGWKSTPTGEWPERFEALKNGDSTAFSDAKDMMPHLKKNTYIQDIGFHTPAWLSHFVSLSKSVAAFVKGQGRGPEKKKALRDFSNNYAAEPWIDYESNREKDGILTLREDRPEGLVPGDGRVAALVAGVDTQDDGFFYVIRAFGWGVIQESWKITSGFVRTLEALKEVLFHYTYKDAADFVYPVHLAVQDAMGHRTREIYDFARMHPGRVQAARGARGRRARPVTMSKIDTYPNSNQMIPGGVILAHVDVNSYKDGLSSLLMVAPTDPGAFHLDAGTTDEYANHLCAETVDEKTRLWINPKNRPNHYWDCEVYALVAADILKIKYWPRPSGVPVEKASSMTGVARSKFMSGGR